MDDGPYPHSRVFRDSRKRHLFYLVELSRAAKSEDPLGGQAEALESLQKDREAYALSRTPPPGQVPDGNVRRRQRGGSAGPAKAEAAALPF